MRSNGRTQILRQWFCLQQNLGPTAEAWHSVHFARWCISFDGLLASTLHFSKGQRQPRNDGPAIAATFLGEFFNAILDVEDQIPGNLSFHPLSCHLKWIEPSSWFVRAVSLVLLLSLSINSLIDQSNQSQLIKLNAQLWRWRERERGLVAGFRQPYSETKIFR